MVTALDAFREQHGLAGGASPIFTKTAGRSELARLFGAMGFRTGAEVGVWRGDFSEVICTVVPGVQLTCVDPWRTYDAYNEQKNNQVRLDDAYRQATDRLKPFGCRLLRMTSLKAAATIPDGSLDFVYIDANHMEPFISQDLTAWAPKVRSGGIVSGHDYHTRPKKPYLKDVKPAVDAFTRTHQVEPWYVLAGHKTPSYFWVVP